MSALDRLADLGPERIRPLQRAEFEAMVAQGMFQDERIELLEGVIVEMSPRNPRPAAVVQRLTKVLVGLAGDQAIVRVQLPLAAASDSLPEPDLAVVPLGSYDDAHPTSALLVVEVAEASLRKDRRIKADLYARAGVPEYWVVNVVDRVIEVHSDPGGASYAHLITARPGETIPVAAFAGAAVPVTAILPP
jgi:Uma2 family endonuclease